MARAGPLAKICDMPRKKIRTKPTLDYEYPNLVRDSMLEFETLVEQIRKDASNAGRNLEAGIRARKNLQRLKRLVILVRSSLFDERDRLEALRHGVTVDAWKRHRRNRD